MTHIARAVENEYNHARLPGVILPSPEAEGELSTPGVSFHLTEPVQLGAAFVLDYYDS